MDFTSIINDAIKSGQTLQDIMKDITAAANIIEQEQKEEKQKSLRRQKVLDQMLQNVKSSIDIAATSTDDAARLLTIAVSKKTDLGLGFDEQDIYKFYAFLTELFSDIDKIYAKRQKAMLEPETYDSTPKSVIEDALNKRKKENEANQSTPTCRSSETGRKNCGSSKSCVDCKSGDTKNGRWKSMHINSPFGSILDPEDMQKVEEFLKDIFR